MSGIDAYVVEGGMADLALLDGVITGNEPVSEAADLSQVRLDTYVPGKTPEMIAAQIASPDVKSTYDDLVIPRKLPGPDGLVDARPIYEHAINKARPGLDHLECLLV